MYVGGQWTSSHEGPHEFPHKLDQLAGLVIFTYFHITNHQVGPATNIQLNIEDTGGVFR